jgi:hypothetical protein
MDVCHVCDTHCVGGNHYGPRPRLDLAPLAKLMWKPVTAKCEFQIVESAARNLAPIGQMPVAFLKFEVDLDMLNYFLQFLRKDENKLKLFGQQMISMPTYTSCLKFNDDDALCRVKLQYQCSDGPRKIDRLRAGLWQRLENHLQAGAIHAVAMWDTREPTLENLQKGLVSS